MYNEKVIKEFSNPQNVGELVDANGVGTVGNATCGDIMKIFLKIDENEVIQDVKFQTYGCGAAIATSSVATNLIKGKTIEEATGHTEAIDEAVAPTCTTEGKTEGKHCSVCGEVLVAQEVLPATGHDFADATCDTPKTCRVCGTIEGEATGHTYDNDCDADCNACGEARTPADHAYGDWALTVEPTLEAEGTEERKCTVCGHTESRSVARLEPETTQAPETEPATEPETEPVTVPETEAPGQSSGCQSAVGVGMALCMAICAVAVALKKKED